MLYPNYVVKCMRNFKYFKNSPFITVKEYASYNLLVYKLSF